MDRKKIKEIKTLVIRLGAVAAIVIVVILLVNLFRSFGDSKEVPIDDTPLRVEQIRSILELNTIRYKDEVVADSVEMLEDLSDIWGRLGNYNSIDELIKPTNIKRRLTLIVKGELLYGVNLKTSDFEIIPKKDTLIIKLPQPELLSATVNPSNTEVFVETGVWSDYARRKLTMKAKKRMIRNGENLNLPLKAREPLERAIKQLVRTDKPIKIIFVQ